MAYILVNKCAKNCCKRTILVQLIVEDVVTCFFGTQCSHCYSLKHKHLHIDDTPQHYLHDAR